MTPADVTHTTAGPCKKRCEMRVRSPQFVVGDAVRPGTHLAVLYLLLLVLLVPVPGVAESNFITRAQTAFQTAQRAYSTNATNLSIALNLALAAFDFAEFSKSDIERERLARIGIGAADVAISLDPDSAAAHYYLGLNIGQLARTKKLGALKLVADMERALKRSIELDPKYANAGALRTLSVLYLEAPGWPMSIGNKTQARTLMLRALELAPSYPASHLNYMEALQKRRDHKSLAERIAIYEVLLPKAQKEFAGENWEDEWANWTQRWETIQAKRK